MIDSIYQLCPPLFSLGLLRIDSPTNHSRDTYSQDKEFFQLHKNRNLYMRLAYLGEFDLEMNLQDWMQAPKLHVLVAKYATGFHQRTPIYRGRSFYYNCDTTDLEVMQIVIEMQRRDGIDIAEWAAFDTQRSKQIEALSDGSTEVAR